MTKDPHLLYQKMPIGHYGLAVSGGPDSVFLAQTFATFCQKNPDYQATILHFDHLTRQGESTRDAQFVQKLAHRLNLSFKMQAFDVAQDQKQSKQGFEVAARQARWSFMTWAQDKYQLSGIITGHQADDQLETVLQHMLRGAGLQGLCGMSFFTTNDSYDYGSLALKPTGGSSNEPLKIWRPLLEIPKKDIIDQLTKNKWSYCHDKTNDDPRFQRNKLRQKLVPLMKTLSPNLLKQIGRLTSNLQEARKALSESQSLWIKNLSDNPLQEMSDLIEIQPSGAIKLKLSYFQQLPRYFQKKILLEAWQSLKKGPDKQLTFEHLEKLNELIHKPRTTKHSCPGHVMAQNKRPFLLLWAT